METKIHQETQWQMKIASRKREQDKNNAVFVNLKGDTEEYYPTSANRA
jgi:hypothetical protein